MATQNAYQLTDGTWSGKTTEEVMYSEPTLTGQLRFAYLSREHSEYASLYTGMVPPNLMLTSTLASTRTSSVRRIGTSIQVARLEFYLRNSASKVKLMGFPLAGVFGVMVYASITSGVKDESERSTCTCSKELGTRERQKMRREREGRTDDTRSKTRRAN